jgi:hypothetical protein
MLFIYFLPQRKEPYLYWLYVVWWSALSSFIAVTFRNLGIMVFTKGGPWIWFVGIMPFLYFMTKHHYYLEATGLNDESD